MKLYYLVPAFLGFLLPLPFCLCSAPEARFFSTHSPHPWSQHHRWRLPSLQHRGLPLEGIMQGNITLSKANRACSLSILNHTSIDSSAESDHHRDDTPARSTKFDSFRLSNVSSSGFLAMHLAHLPSENLTGFGSNSGREDNEASACYGSQVKDVNGYVRIQGSQVLHAAGLLVWLGLLFYLLGTTASDYFSCTLEKLSDVLHLSPAVAGVTLLAIGNGAPDVFSSVVAFASSDRTGSIGFGSVLGGALFVTTIVSGTVSLVTSKGSKEPKFVIFRGNELSRKETIDSGAVGTLMQNGSSGISMGEGMLPGSRGQQPKIPTSTDIVEGSVKVDMISFIRDIIFLLVAVGALTLVLLDGEVQLWEAIAFFCMYPVYAIFVWTAELLQNRHRRQRSSLLDLLLVKAAIESSLPQWADVYQIQEHGHYHVHSQDLEAEVERLWEDPRDHSLSAKLKHWILFFYRYCIEWPLALPRQLTIPVVEEERWSRKFAIASCTLAPVFVAAVWALNYSSHVEPTLIALGIGGGLGILLGLLAYFNTDDAQPPQQSLTLWLAGGFFMSVIWFYLVANELVESLQSLGNLFGINTTILALTVLAWGNSIGDLVADLSLACSGPDGVQIAISGCYAGPLFNTLVGLGLSLVLGSLKSKPEPFLIADKDGSLFYIIGFLALGLIWALTILPLQGMRLGRSLGIGLIVLYCSFFVIGVCYAMGWLT